MKVVEMVGYKGGIKVEKKWYTTYEVAKMLGVSPMTVWRWCKTGKIRAGKTPGGYYSIPKDEVERILKQMRGE